MIACGVSYGIFFGNEKVLYGTYLLTFFSLASYAYAFHKKWVYYLTIALIPVSIVMDLPGTGMSLSLPSELLEFVLFGLFLVYALFKGVNKQILTHPLTVLLLIDMAWIFTASITGTMPDVSLKRLLMKANYFVVFYFLFSELNLTKPNKSTISFLFYAFGLIFTMIYTINQLASYNFDPRVAFILSQPFFAEHTVYGACLAFVIPFISIVLFRSEFKLSAFGKLFLFGVLTLLLVSISIALSRAALLSLVVALAFWLLIQLRIKTWMIISLLFVFGIGTYSYRLDIYNKITANKAVSNDGNVVNHLNSVTNIESDASNLERINRWICAWEMFKERPLNGFGPGTYQFKYAQFQSWQNKTYISTTHGNKGNAHSEYLTYLSETGIIGFLIFIGIVFYSIHLGLENYYQQKNATIKYIVLSALLGLTTFFFHGLFNAFSDQDEMAFLYYASMGVILLADIHRRNQIASR